MPFSYIKNKYLIAALQKVVVEADFKSVERKFTEQGIKEVGGDLCTPITKLPEGLTVNRDLDLRDTQITELPEGLKVKEYIYVTNKSKIKCNENLRLMG